MSIDASKGIWIAVITGLLAIFGSVVQGRKRHNFSFKRL